MPLSQFPLSHPSIPTRTPLCQLLPCHLRPLQLQVPYLHLPNKWKSNLPLGKLLKPFFKGHLWHGSSMTTLQLPLMLSHHTSHHLNLQFKLIYHPVHPYTIPPMILFTWSAWLSPLPCASTSTNSMTLLLPNVFNSPSAPWPSKNTRIHYMKRSNGDSISHHTIYLLPSHTPSLPPCSGHSIT